MEVAYCANPFTLGLQCILYSCRTYLDIIEDANIVHFRNGLKQTEVHSHFVLLKILFQGTY